MLKCLIGLVLSMCFTGSSSAASLQSVASLAGTDSCSVTGTTSATCGVLGSSTTSYASATASYGAIDGVAAVNVFNPLHPNSAAAYASAGFLDQFTITGFSGIGYLDVSATASHFTSQANQVFGLGILSLISDFATGRPFVSLPFIYGTPFDFGAQGFAEGDNLTFGPERGPERGGFHFNVDSIAVLSCATCTTNPVVGYSVSTASGTSYAFVGATVATVPEPGTFPLVLFAIGSLVSIRLNLANRRARRTATRWRHVVDILS